MTAAARGNGDDVALTGLPRSGTTLTCHLLNKLPDVVALNEPMRVDKLAELRDRGAACDEIARFFTDTRKMIAETGMAPSWHVAGKVPDNVVGNAVTADGLRKNQGARGLISIGKTPPSVYMLCVKHPAAFTALLPDLSRRFRVYAVVRNPLSVLSSWNSVNMAHGQGHAPAAENLDPGLRARLAAMSDVLDRQLHLIDWFFRQYRSGLDSESVIRYEDIVSSGGTALSRIAPSATTLREPLVEKNANKLYKPETVRTLAGRLLASDGAYWSFYQRADVERVQDAILADA